MAPFAKIDRHAQLVGRMGRACGVDFGASLASGRISAETYRAAVLSCSHCARPEDCAAGLDADVFSSAPSWCRNVDLLARLGRHETPA